jgi:hypothetical protein
VKVYADRETAHVEQRKKGGRMLVAHMDEKRWNAHEKSKKCGLHASSPAMRRSESRRTEGHGSGTSCRTASRRTRFHSGDSSATGRGKSGKGK